MKFNTAELLELPSNGNNKDHRRIFHEFGVGNCLNYQVIEETRMVGEGSSRKFNPAELLELPSNGKKETQLYCLNFS